MVIATSYAASVRIMTTLRRLGAPSSNPFCPDFGQPPRSLVGRDDLLGDLGSGLATGPTDRRYTSLLLGPRGSGKTVALAALEDMAAADGWLVISVDAGTGGLPERIKQAIAWARDNYEGADQADPDQHLRTRWSGIRIGGFEWRRQVFRRIRPEWNMQHQMAALAEHAAGAGTAVLLTVDEMHSGDREDLRRLAGDLQHITKRSHLPLAFVGAGLSRLEYTLLEDSRMTFFQRCARARIPPITTADAMRGLRSTVVDAGGHIELDALRLAADATGSLPYQLQLIGHNAWNIAGAPDRPIDLLSSREAVRIAADQMEETIAIPAWYDLGAADQRYLRAVAELGPAATPAALSQTLASGAGNLARSERRLSVSGYIAETPAGTIALTDMVPAPLVLRLVEAEARYETDYALRVSGRRATTARLIRCEAYMPRAKATCVLGRGHRGGHRSR